MVHPISLGIALYLLWIVLSGYFQPLLLVLGVMSTLIVLFIALRMEVVDRESHPVHLTLRLPLYWLWLLWEIVKSNVVVARLIWSPSLPISPSVFQVPTSQKSQLGQVVYANSITLTPGTVSMTLENNQVRVHALTEDIAEDLQTGTMDRRVTALEGES
ncbi:MAG: Na+/H+ antiporter subunit E [Nitrospirales bacterium]